MPSRLATPPPTSASTPLVLCADGGGSKICVVIRSADGVEVRGTAGPCNVQSVGYGPAIQAILLATYRALALLPRTHLPPGLIIPPLDSAVQSIPNSPASTSPPRISSSLAVPQPVSVTTHPAQLSISSPASPFASRPGSPKVHLPPITIPLFQYVWLGLAGISTKADAKAFMPYVTKHLGVDEPRVKITNDVNLLAAPALGLPGIKHVAAVVCGTGTVGRTLEVHQPSTINGGPSAVHALPLEDVAVSRGWGYMLCDEGSAFWLGRLAIRSLLFTADRLSSSPIYAASARPLLPLHNDLLAYFGVPHPMDLISIVSLTGPFVEGLSVGEATAKRNAFMAGAARVVFKWAFPEDTGTTIPPSPPASDGSASSFSHTQEMQPNDDDPVAASHAEALKLARSAVRSLIELTIDLLGDGSIVRPENTALALGGGLWMSKGYRNLLLEGLRKEGVVFRETVVVGDAAGAGAAGLAKVEFGE